MSYRNRLCLVTDIKGYSAHSATEHADAQRRLLQVMNFACRNAGIRWVSSRDRQDRGDGRLYVFSPRLDETLVIPRLLIGLRHGLYQANCAPGAFGRVRLRAAMARGIIARGPTGYLGQAPITACRLVDSAQLKKGIDDADDADLAFIAPDDLFQDVIKQDFPGLPADEFTRVDVSVKEFSGVGWMYLPPAGPALAPGDSDAAWETVLAGAAGAGAGALVWEILSGPDGGLDSDDHDAGSGLPEGWEQDTGWDLDEDHDDADDHDDHDSDDADDHDSDDATAADDHLDDGGDWGLDL